MERKAIIRNGRIMSIDMGDRMADVVNYVMWSEYVKGIPTYIATIRCG